MLPPPRNLLACVLTLSLALPALAADPKPAGDDPKARQLLDEVAKVYKGLDAYADQGEFVLSATVNGKSETVRSPLKVSFVRPARCASTRARCSSSATARP